MQTTSTSHVRWTTADLEIFEGDRVNHHEIHFSQDREAEVVSLDKALSSLVVFHQERYFRGRYLKLV